MLLYMSFSCVLVICDLGVSDHHLISTNLRSCLLAMEFMSLFISEYDFYATIGGY